MVDLPSDTHPIHNDTHTAQHTQVTMASGGSGSVVIGDYVVTRMLGSGSFAVVQYSPIAVVAPPFELACTSPIDSCIALYPGVQRTPQDVRARGCHQGHFIGQA